MCLCRIFTSGDGEQYLLVSETLDQMLSSLLIGMNTVSGVGSKPTFPNNVEKKENHADPSKKNKQLQLT